MTNEFEGLENFHEAMALLENRQAHEGGLLSERKTVITQFQVEDDAMPTNKPARSRTPHDEMTERRIAEFALEESRLSNLAYRFKLTPRDRVWKNWDRTEFEPNHYRIVGLAGRAA